MILELDLARSTLSFDLAIVKEHDLGLDLAIEKQHTWLYHIITLLEIIPSVHSVQNAITYLLALPVLQVRVSTRATRTAGQMGLGGL